MSNCQVNLRVVC